MSTEGLTKRARYVAWHAQRSSFLGSLRSYVRFTELPRTASKSRERRTESEGPLQTFRPYPEASSVYENALKQRKEAQDHTTVISLRTPIQHLILECRIIRSVKVRHVDGHRTSILFEEFN